MRLAVSPTVAATADFAQQLGWMVRHAPEQVAAGMLEKLRQDCLAETNLGNSSCTVRLDYSGQRPFIDQVARQLVKQVDTLGFKQIKWWNGHDWEGHVSQRRFNILHRDAMYNKFFSKVVVHWHRSGPQIDPKPYSGIVQDLQDTLDKQQEQLGDWRAEIENVELEAEIHTEEAAEAEKQFLKNLSNLEDLRQKRRFV